MTDRGGATDQAKGRPRAALLILLKNGMCFAYGESGHVPKESVGVKRETTRYLFLVAVAVAVAIIVVPSCQMVGCSMTMGSTMPWGHQSVPGMFGDCGGTWVYTQAPDAVLTSSTRPIVGTAAVGMLAVLATLLFAGAAFPSRLAIAPAPPPPPTGVSVPLRI